MTTIRDIADRYNVSKATARRWCLAAAPEAFGGSGTVKFDQDQMHRIADFVANHSRKREPAVREPVYELPESVHESVSESVEWSTLYGYDPFLSGSVRDYEPVHEPSESVHDSVREPVQTVTMKRYESVLKQLNDAKIQAATYRERSERLESENALLRERLDAADRALEREQMTRAGFWSRLGQRLLGDGKRKDQ